MKEKTDSKACSNDGMTLAFRRTVDFAVEALGLEAGSYLVLATSKSEGPRGGCALVMNGDSADLAYAMTHAMMSSDKLCDVMQGMLDILKGMEKDMRGGEGRSRVKRPGRDTASDQRKAIAEFLQAFPGINQAEFAKLVGMSHAAMRKIKSRLNNENND